MTIRNTATRQGKLTRMGLTLSAAAAVLYTEPVSASPSDAAEHDVATVTAAATSGGAYGRKMRFSREGVICYPLPCIRMLCCHVVGI